jgi:hypothetical protein
LSRDYSDERRACAGKEIQGTFYWRVSLVDKEKRAIVTSNISRAGISAGLKEPAIISPANNQAIDMTEQDTLFFSWKNVGEAGGYHIRIFQGTPGFDRLIFEIDTNDTGIAFTRMDLLDIGNFYWELQALAYSGNTIIKRSKVIKNNFSLKLEEPVLAPDLISADTLYIK